VDVSRVLFIAPAQPVLRSSPPTDENWQFELKFDGYRVQLHKAGAGATIFSRNGGDFTRRFPAIAAAVLGLPTKSCIIDGELIAAGRHGEPDFLALLHGRHVPTCVYCFDHLELNGRDPPRAAARAATGEAQINVGTRQVQPDRESFPDAGILLAERATAGARIAEPDGFRPQFALPTDQHCRRSDHRANKAATAISPTLGPFHVAVRAL
jgi:hypothetical protein